MRGRTRAVLAAAAIVVAAVCAGCTAGPRPSTPTRSAPVPSASAPTGGGVTALLVQATGKALVVRGSDAADHVEYNLLAISGFSDPVTLTSVTVVGPDGRDLERIDGAALAAATQSVFPPTPSAVIAPSAAVVIEVDLAVPPGQTVPTRVTHRIDYALPPVAGAAIFDRTEVTGVPVSVDRTPATRIAPPMAGNGWLATSACCTPNIHRDLRLPANGDRLSTSETFAVDWAKVKGDRVYDSAGATNEAFYGYGEAVLAVADGTVVAARDGIPESTPFLPENPQPREGSGGNFVILKIADGVYAFYAHLQTGSVAVHVGDTVKTGQVIGRLGNTGPSTGAHLHFGLLDRPDFVTGTSLPFVLPRFTLKGAVDFAATTGDTLVIAPASRALSTAYPLYGTIIDLG